MIPLHPSYRLIHEASQHVDGQCRILVIDYNTDCIHTLDQNESSFTLLTNTLFKIHGDRVGTPETSSLMLSLKRVVLRKNIQRKETIPSCMKFVGVIPSVFWEEFLIGNFMFKHADMFLFYLKCFNDDNNCFVNVSNINLEKNY